MNPWSGVGLMLLVLGGAAILTYTLSMFSIVSSSARAGERLLDLRVVDGALSDAECAHLVALGEAAGMARSKAGGSVHPARTSKSAYLTRKTMLEDPIVRGVTERIAALAGVTPLHVEPLQVLRYDGGEEYKCHFDVIGPDDSTLARWGNRTKTALAYLSDECAGSGGGTTFCRLNRTVRAKRGRAVVWNNLAPDGVTTIEASQHAGDPVSAGCTKYALNAWIRALPDDWSPR